MHCFLMPDSENCLMFPCPVIGDSLQWVQVSAMPGVDL